MMRAMTLAGIEKVTPKGDNEIRCACPAHKGDSGMSSVISLEKRFFYCFVCKAFHSLAMFCKLFKVDFEPTYEAVKKAGFRMIDVHGFENRSKLHEDTSLEAGQRLFQEAGDRRMYRDVDLYLRSRLGPSYELPGRLVIKRHDERNTLLFKAVEPMITERFPKNSHQRFLNYGLASIFHHYRKPQDWLFVAEGLFDYLKLCQLGLNACALMTSSISDLRLRQLESISTKNIVLFLDNDLAGQSGTIKARKRLTQVGCRIYEVKYWPELPEDATDPGSLSYEILLEMIYESLEGTELADSELFSQCRGSGSPELREAGEVREILHPDTLAEKGGKFELLCPSESDGTADEMVDDSEGGLDDGGVIH